MGKKYYTPEQLANRKKGILKTEEASATEQERKANDRARSKDFFAGFNN